MALSLAYVLIDLVHAMLVFNAVGKLAKVGPNSHHNFMQPWHVD